MAEKVLCVLICSILYQSGLANCEHVNESQLENATFINVTEGNNQIPAINETQTELDVPDLEDDSFESEEDLPLADVGDSMVQDFLHQRQKRQGEICPMMPCGCPTPKCVCCKAPKWLWSTTPSPPKMMMKMMMMPLAEGVAPEHRAGPRKTQQLQQSNLFNDGNPYSRAIQKLKILNAKLRNSAASQPIGTGLGAWPQGYPGAIAPPFAQDGNTGPSPGGNTGIDGSMPEITSEKNENVIEKLQALANDIEKLKQNIIPGQDDQNPDPGAPKTEFELQAERAQVGAEQGHTLDDHMNQQERPELNEGWKNVDEGRKYPRTDEQYPGRNRRIENNGRRSGYIEKEDYGQRNPRLLDDRRFDQILELNQTPEPRAKGKWGMRKFTGQEKAAYIPQQKHQLLLN